MMIIIKKYSETLMSSHVVNMQYLALGWLEKNADNEMILVAVGGGGRLRDERVWPSAEGNLTVTGTRDRQFYYYTQTENIKYV
jgi:hypothetical protein